MRREICRAKIVLRSASQPRLAAPDATSAHIFTSAGRPFAAWMRTSGDRCDLQRRRGRGGRTAPGEEGVKRHQDRTVGGAAPPLPWDARPSRRAAAARSLPGGGALCAPIALSRAAALCALSHTLPSVSALYTPVARSPRTAARPTPLYRTLSPGGSAPYAPGRPVRRIQSCNKARDQRIFSGLFPIIGSHHALWTLHLGSGDCD